MSSLAASSSPLSPSAKWIASLAPEQVDAHPLDRADVDEAVAELGIRQQRVRHDVRVEPLVLVEVVVWKRCE